MTDLESSLRTMIRAIVREEIQSAIDDARGAEYLSTQDAAELARVAEGTIRRWIRERRLPGKRAGRCMRILRSDLENLLRSGSEPSNDLSPEEMARREFG